MQEKEKEKIAVEGCKGWMLAIFTAACDGTGPG